MHDYSDYIVYVDESGDHSLTSIDIQYPVFVLAFCVFEKQAYAQQAIPVLQGLKFKYFGHDMVILHEREIRKQLGFFTFLADHQKRKAFQDDLSGLIAECPFTLIAIVIHKQRLAEKYVVPSNPYAIAVQYGLERLYSFLADKDQSHKITHVVFEGRGKKEDTQLELEFRRVCDGKNFNALPFPFQIVFACKQTNSGGLQIADLVARPTGRYIMNPLQKNRAVEILQMKFYKNKVGKAEGYGLKIFP